MEKDTESEDQKLSPCPYCRQEISLLATVCPSCQQTIKGSRKVWRIIKSILEAASLIASIILLYSVFDTRDQLKVQRDANDLQRQQNGQTDSTLALFGKQLSLLREQIEADREANVESRRNREQKDVQYRSEMKPVVIVRKIDCKLTTDTLVLYFNAMNTGKSEAFGATVEMIAKFPNDPRVFLRPTKYIAGRILPQETKIDPLFTPLSDFGRHNELVIRTISRWKWPAYATTDSIIKFFHVTWDIKKWTTDVKSLSPDRLDVYWRE